MQSFGDHIRQLRKQRDWTQVELADRCDLSPDTIRRLETDAFSPSLRTLAKTAAGFGLSLTGLFHFYENGFRDQDHLYELINSRSPEDLQLAMSVIRALFDKLDELDAVTTEAPEPRGLAWLRTPTPKPRR